MERSVLRKIDFWHWSFDLPRSQWARIVLGILLIFGGLLGFLPVLGFWMLPLGLLVLSVDLPFVRRWRRQFAVWWYTDTARKEAKNGKKKSSAE